jgi:Calcineurin-like phosphoesterase
MLNRRQFVVWSTIGVLSTCTLRRGLAQPTSPLSNPPRGDVRLVVISDLNGQYGSIQYDREVDQAIALMPQWQPDLVLCGGDMVAGQSRSLSRDRLRAMWAAFDQHVASPLQQQNIPFGFTLGNHDASGALRQGQYSFATDREEAAAYWNAPNHTPELPFVDRARFPFYYTFLQRDIFFLVWDASTATLSAEQRQWVNDSLSSDRAQNARLRIVIGHLPLYAIAVGRDRPGEYLAQAEELRSLLERHRVHTYISGHQHAYYPGHKGQLQLLHCGLLGSGARRLRNGDGALRKTLTVVDIDLSIARTTYTTYDMATLTWVDQQQLPRLIASPTGLVLRRDVTWNDLTPEERAIAHQPADQAAQQNYLSRHK